MKKYHGSRKQFSYVENEDFISPLEAIDKVNDDDFIDGFLESPKSKLSFCIKIIDDGLNNGVGCFELEHSLLRTTRSKK